MIWWAVVNNDVSLEQDWLERMMDAVSNSESWFATSKIFQSGRHSDARRNF